MSPAKKRRLKRNVSREALPVKVESVMRIRGGVRKRWFVLDTVEAMGRECVSIGSIKPLLHTLLGGNMHMSKYYHAINNFVADCFDAVNRGKRGPPGSAKKRSTSSIAGQA